MKIEDFAVQICPISSADVVEVKRLEEECDLSPWAVNDYYAEIDREDSLTLIAKVDGEIVGFVVARLIRAKYQPPISEIEIYNICVSKNYRRNGIGQLFIYEIIKVTRNKINSIWLEVRESNEQAISFYENLGFRTINTRRSFYSHPTENGLIMKKKL